MRVLTSFTALTIFVAVAFFSIQQIQPINQIHSSNKTVFKKVKKTKRYDQPSEAAAWLASMRNTPKGKTSAQLNMAYQQQMKLAKSQKADPNLPALKFEELGPGIFGGRIRAFVIHPEREGHLLAGGILGGVWKSTDDGKSWEPKTDFLENIAIGSMLIDPDNPEKVYLGTGEGYFNFDSAQGNGIYVSEDFGESWELFGSTDSETFFYVNRMAKISGSNTFFAATRQGIFRTTNGGQVWSEVSNINTSGRGFTDLQIDPTNSNHLLAYHFGSANTTLDLTITSPASLAGTYASVTAAFGPRLTEVGVTGTIVNADDGSGTRNDACDPIVNDLTNKIALIIRGECTFVTKVKNAQDAGAVAVIVYLSDPQDSVFSMGGDDDEISIPSIMVDNQLGLLINAQSEIANGIIKIGPIGDLNRFMVRSTNGGQNWSILDDDGLPGVNLERMEIAFAADGTAYVAASKVTEELENGSTNGTLGLYKADSDSNISFIKTASNANFVERQGWYDLAIAVNPSDVDHVVMGAVDQYITFDGGSNISKNSYWNAPSGLIDQYIHADHHGYFFSPHNNNHIYTVSDGGVSKSEDSGATYTSLNNGLNISQSYGIAVSPDGQRITSGTQDNGSQLYFGDQQAWLEWYGGDGGYSAWDQQQGQYVYGSYVNGQMYGSSNGGMSTSDMDLPDTDGARFIQPFVLDESNGNRMLVGTDNVFFTNNARFLSNATWEDVSSEIGDAGASVSAVSFNPHQSSTAFAGMTYADSSFSNHVVKITGLGSTNVLTDITPPSNLNTYQSIVTDIKVDLYDTSGNTIYVTFADYFENRILRSTDGGASWSSISNNLPDIPLYQIHNDPTDSNVLYLGSELGLWIGKKSGNTYNWSHFDYGPAFTRVIDLVWNNGVLFVGTHGRGTYKASKQSVEISLVKFLATNSSCDVDNYLDLGESGKLMIAVKNHSGKSFNEINVSFNEPNFIDFTNANQSFSLPAFAEKIIALPTSLSSQASCLTNISIPVTISSDEGSYDTNLDVLTAANQTHQFGTFTDGAESNDSPMKSVLSLGNDGWIQVNDSVNSGNQSWFTTNEGIYSDKSLITPWLTFDGGGNVLEFAMSYNTEGTSFQYWDGLVLEMRLLGSEHWFDIGHLSSIPYDGQLSTNNTAQAQFAWSGSQLNWRETSVNLGTSYVGKTAQIRFRMVSDSNTSIDGFWIDDINLTNVIDSNELTCDECVSDDDNTIPNKGLWYDPAHDGHGFIVEAVGANDLFYTMFYTYDNNGDPEWFNSLTTLSNGVLNQGFESGTLSKFKYDFDLNPTQEDPVFPDPDLTDGRLTIDFNSQDVSNHPACQDGVTRPLEFVALVTWRINDVTEEWCIMPLIADEAKPEPDFGTAWWGGQDENGWGYSLAQTGDIIIAYVFYYDALGNARWATGSTDGFQTNTDITIPMLDVFGYGRTDEPIGTTLVSSGTLMLNLANTFMDLDTDGTSSIDVTYQGSEGGRWLRNDIKIMNLVREH